MRLPMFYLVRQIGYVLECGFPPFSHWAPHRVCGATPLHASLNWSAQKRQSQSLVDFSGQSRQCPVFTSSRNGQCSSYASYSMQLSLNLNKSHIAWRTLFFARLCPVPEYPHVRTLPPVPPLSPQSLYNRCRRCRRKSSR
jgi:hypothetical protein